MKKINQFLLTFLMIGFLLFFGSKFFLINQIECQTSLQTEQKEQVCEWFNTVLGKPLFFVDYLNDLNSELASNQTDRGSIFQIEKIEKYIGGKIVFYIQLVPPTYRLTVDSQSYMVTDSGFLLANDLNRDLPLVFAQSWLIEQDRVKEHSNQFLKKALASLIARGVNFSRVEVISSDDVRIELDNQFVALLSLSLDPEVEINRLSQILNNVDQTSLDPTLKVIDLRFNLPVYRESIK